MRLRSSKVNEFRLWGLMLTMSGLLLMVTGTVGIAFHWGTAGQIIAAVCMIVGLISIMVSMGVYFWAGMMSTSATVLDCPECGRRTKLIGKTDRCMFCKTILSVDPLHAPQEPLQTSEQH